MKLAVLVLGSLLAGSAFASTTEQRQDYMSKMSLEKFMTPSDEANYYWQNLSEVLPTALIARNGEIKALPRLLKRDFAETTIKGKNITDFLEVDDAPMQALMVIEKGVVTYQHFNIDPQQKHVWMSNAKTVAGLLVAMLEEEGKIDVNETLGRYIPKVKGTAWQDIKVIHLLNQQSGLDLEEHDQARYNPKSYVAQFLHSEVVGEDYLENLLKIPTAKKPGTAFEYSSVNTQMLGLLISTVTNQRLSEVIEERIWSKAGMSSDAVLALSPQGYEIIHGVLSSNLEDMMRYGLLYTPSWNATASEPVIPTDVIKRMQTSVTPNVYDKGLSGTKFIAMTGDKPLGASYQWDKVWSDGDMYKSGMRGQGIYVSPDKDIVIGWFSQQDIEINAATFARTYVKSVTK